jgi:hypothetical protein
MKTGFNIFDDAGKEKRWKLHRKKIFVTGTDVFLLTFTAMATGI